MRVHPKGAAAVVLMSHLGRPNGKVVEKYSLKPVAEELERLIQRPVAFLEDCIGTKVEQACAGASQGMGDVLLGSTALG